MTPSINRLSPPSSRRCYLRHRYPSRCLCADSARRPVLIPPESWTLFFGRFATLLPRQISRQIYAERRIGSNGKLASRIVSAISRSRTVNASIILSVIAMSSCMTSCIILRGIFSAFDGQAVGDHNGAGGEEVGGPDEHRSGADPEGPVPHPAELGCFTHLASLRRSRPAALV